VVAQPHDVDRLGGRLRHDRTGKYRDVAPGRHRGGARREPLVLDFASHGPDMPLWPEGPRLGLGLWRSVPATLAVEIAMYVAGVVLYMRATLAKDRVGTWALLGLVGLLFVAYIGNVLGPPPPSGTAVAVSALALWLVPLWGIWIERHRASP
jgi:hypothetical protein